MTPNRPFVTSPRLTAFAIGYRNPAYNFIADAVLPRVPVGAEKFSWTEYPLEEGFRVVDNRVGRTGRVNRVEFSGAQRESAVEDFGLDAPVPYSDIEAADAQPAVPLQHRHAMEAEERLRRVLPGPRVRPVAKGAVPV